VKSPQLPWARLLAEGLLIIVSVYLAIVLEGMSQDRAARREAHTALGQMLHELREDRSDLQEIRAEQIIKKRHFRSLDGWMASPEAMPLETFAGVIDSVFWSNRTLYPRRSAWTTMVAAGQLGELHEPGLVTRLGDFYESFTVRVIDAGEDYDENLNEVARNSAPRAWDGTTGRLLTTDVGLITAFRSQLRYLHFAWTVWYVDLLDAYEQSIDALIGEIGEYLGEHGHAAKSESGPP
jgi:hypothetical protein